MAPNATVTKNDSESDGAEIKEPHDNDVLCGRGGSINSWKGNERFRTLVEKRKRVYLTARFKREKRLIASSIVQDIQSLDPPGRFLSKNAKKGTWYEIEDDKARDKVSQALRENAPTIRAEIETEINEQRAEIQRTEYHAPPPPPNGAPPNPYYPQQQQQQQGWGYFSYYGYAQQLLPHNPAMPPPPPPPPPPSSQPHGDLSYPQQLQQQQQHSGYSSSPDGQWHAAANASPQMMQQQQQPHHLSPNPSPPSSSSQPPHHHPPDPPAAFTAFPSNNPSPTQEHQQMQQQQQREQQMQQQQQQRMQQQIQQQQEQQRQQRIQQQQEQQRQQQIQQQQEHQMQQQQEQQMQQQQQPPQSFFNSSLQQHQQQQDDEKSIFDSSVSDLMSAVLPLSIASWTKDAFSIGGTSNRDDDYQETASVASKPIKYFHQPADSPSVSSRARSVTFKDERSISGRPLDIRKHSNKPPRIMHSSQINYPRRPKMGGGSVSNGRPPAPNNNATNNTAMAPVSSVHLNDINDGMISIITTEGMNSIMEEGASMMDAFQQSEMEKNNDPTYEHFKKTEQQQSGGFHPMMPPPGMTDHRRIKKRAYRRPPSFNTAPDDASNSMLTAVANQIVMGLGSWDGASIACGPETAAARTPRAIDAPKDVPQFSETMAVEIEGQEVQLVDMMDSNSAAGSGDNSVLEDRMPPHSHDKERLQMMDWPSRVGSCHSFFNDSLAGAALFSAGGIGIGGGGGGEPESLASSMDMDVSSGTDPFSCAGSIGGGSLCRVFDAEGVARELMPYAMPSPSSYNRVLTQMPSWERSLRSKSPLSVGSGDAAEEDHCSFMTKSSEKLMGGSISSGDNTNRNNNDTSEGMRWEDHKKE